MYIHEHVYTHQRILYYILVDGNSSNQMVIKVGPKMPYFANMDGLLTQSV